MSYQKTISVRIDNDIWELMERNRKVNRNRFINEAIRNQCRLQQMVENYHEYMKLGESPAEWRKSYTKFNLGDFNVFFK